jgi:hypothetical protein
VAELSLQKPVYGSASGEWKRGCSSFRRYENLPHQFQHRKPVVGRKARPELENKSKYRTSPWQSSLCRNLFVALQVENPRRDAVVSNHLQFSPISVSLKTQK